MYRLQGILNGEAKSNSQLLWALGRQYWPSRASGGTERPAQAWDAVGVDRLVEPAG